MSPERSIVLLKLLLCIALACLPACTPMFESNFYYPTRDPFPTPPGVADIAIPTPDGLTLHGWLLRPADAAPDQPLPAVLHAHGNAGNVSMHAAYSDFLTEHGFAVLVFDYRGYGRSDLPPRGAALNRAALLTDTIAALDALRTLPGVDPERIALFGNSLGGVLGLAAAAERQEIRAVVAVAPFSSWKAIARRHAGQLGAMVIPAGLDAEDSIARLGARPVLLVHGERDDIVPPAHTQRLAEAAAAAGVPASTELAPHSGHNDVLVDDPALQRRVADFLRASLRAPE